MSSTTQEAQAPKEKATYEAGCHCGYIKFAVTLSPPLSSHTVLNCNCSACVRFGYLLVYPHEPEVQWHNDSRSRVAGYRFNSKEKEQMFCPKCGASLGIDFQEAWQPHTYGISVRTIYGVNLDELTYKKFDGDQVVKPAGDLSGHWWDEEKQEMK
ncbi:glutathione-dependent formaldehyde-activating enzyme [Xylariomycetidae sp. FL0641]|nr:glutathione-dependent formaldehyde-activating enzyme [Xylariomycetidae sp. FL0641]